jgi:hypothetical protein
MYTVADSLAAISPCLPTGLVGPESLAAIGLIADRLPAGLCECFGFEIRIGEVQARTDFALQVSTPAAWRLLAGLSASSPVAHGPAASAWERITAFGTAWCESGGQLPEVIPSAWLEFDIEPSSPRRGIPAVFLELGPRVDNAAAAQLALTMIPELAAAPISPSGRRAFAACVENLPPDASISQVGTMLSRSVAALRLCASGLEPSAIPAYLGSLGTPGLPGLAERILAAAPVAGERLKVDLDIFDSVRPRVGIEYAVPDSRQLDGQQEPRWHQLLDRLADAGLCTPAKRDAVLEWSGAVRVKFPHRPQPVTAFRGISHAKVEADAEGRLGAKAYVGFLPDRLSLMFAATDSEMAGTEVPA